MVCELSTVTKANEVWAEISSGSIEWRASIYGFPTPNGLIDASISKCDEAPDAQRYVVKAIDWRSLALTKRPVNGHHHWLGAHLYRKGFRQGALQSGAAQRGGARRTCESRCADAAVRLSLAPAQSHRAARAVHPSHRQRQMRIRRADDGTRKLDRRVSGPFRDLLLSGFRSGRLSGPRSDAVAET